MALPLPPGLTPNEIAFLCEMELVTIIPRQRLEAQQLLGGETPALRPPQRADSPLWLALLLKRQRRASIVPPPWLQPTALQEILDTENSNSYRTAFTPTTPFPAARSSKRTDNPSASPPFQRDATADAPSEMLPYHFLEMSHLLLASAADDIPESETVRRLLRDLQEVRTAKMRGLVGTLDSGAGVNLTGIGALEVGEGRAFLTGVVDGLRKLGSSKEAAERERIEENGYGGGRDDDDDDDDMEL